VPSFFVLLVANFFIGVIALANACLAVYNQN
jgi:hypothetical protein